MDFEGGFTETPAAPEPSVPAEPAASPQPAETTTTSGPTEASVRPSEPFMSEALSGVDLGGFEPTTSRDVVEPASDLGVEDAVSVDPNPFAINQSGLSEGGHEKVRQSQAASGSVGGTHHSDAGKEGKSRHEGQKEAARVEHFAQMVQYAARIQAQIQDAPFKDEEVEIDLGNGKTVTMTQGDLYTLSKTKSAAAPPGSAEALWWSRMADLTDPYNKHDPAAVKAHADSGFKSPDLIQLTENDFTKDAKAIGLNPEVSEPEAVHAEHATTDKLTSDFISEGGDQMAAASFAALGSPETESEAETQPGAETSANQEFAEAFAAFGPPSGAEGGVSEAAPQGLRSTGSASGPLEVDGISPLTGEFAAKANPPVGEDHNATTQVAANFDAKAFNPVA